MAIRLRVGDILEERRMTAYQLAKQSGGRISLSAAYRLAESNSGTFPPSWEMLEILCEVLKVDVCDLFHRSGSKRGR
jgi:transcriptional regulator with XRE-family HTH domain